ncbi:MerR family DNA-binding transcriptional regulator [soil metagenome]
MSPQPTFSISELAREFDVTPRTIRFYEDQGLLAPLRDGSRRVYSARDRTRLKLTLRGKRLGLSLSEILAIVTMYESPKDTAAQLRKLLGSLASHREQLERQREDLEATLSELSGFEAQCRAQLSGLTDATPGRKVAGPAKKPVKSARKTAPKQTGLR